MTTPNEKAASAGTADDQMMPQDKAQAEHSTAPRQGEGGSMDRLEEIRSHWITPPGGRAYWDDASDAMEDEVRWLLGHIDQLREALGYIANSKGPGLTITFRRVAQEALEGAKEVPNA